ncbi:MliC family protein [Neisseriaceae bacterium B1]
MNMKHIAMIAATAAALSACVGNSDQVVPATTQHADHAKMESTTTKQAPNGTFVCENGMTVKTEYMTDGAGNNNRVKLTVDTMEMSTTLQETVSASGVRYAASEGFYGNMTEWHEKSGEAAFSFHDKEKSRVHTVCRAS